MERTFDRGIPPSLSWWDVDNPTRDCHGIHDRATADHVCRAALMLLRPRLASVVIDANSDYRKKLKDSPAALAAQDVLRRRGGERRRGDRGMQIRLDPNANEDWALILDYASWSINVDLHTSPTNPSTGEIHDCGHDITLLLTEDESRRLAEEITPGLTLTRRESPPT